MASPLARRVGRAIGRGLWGDADRVAIAVSGGADSVALAWLLSELEPRARWTLAGLIHVNHGLRGDESDADAEFCHALAARLDLPIHVTEVDVTGHRGGLSLEAAARQLRYAAFDAAARQLSAAVVVTGHTCDDQAETVLLRLLRGAASRGVSAIRARRGPYARPLLDCRRSELRAYLEERGEPFREDSSNRNQAIPRNRLRQTLMPVIEASWPGGVRALARFAALAAEDERLLSNRARAAAGRILSGADGVELRRGPLEALPVAIARRVVRDAIETAGGRPSFRDIEAVRRLARADKPHSRLMLHGLAVERAGDVIRVTDATSAAAPHGFAHSLAVPGSVLVAETGESVHASVIVCAERPEVDSRSAVFQADAMALPLTVRSRRPGDRLQPLGAPGTRKLQDVLIDRKVPVAERDRVPVVVDATGRIVWVAGIAMAHPYRVTAPGAGMVILKLDQKTKDNQ